MKRCENEKIVDSVKGAVKYMFQMGRNVLVAEQTVRKIMASNAENENSIYKKYLRLEQTVNQDLKIPVVYKFEDKNCSLSVLTKNNHISLYYSGEGFSLEVSYLDSIKIIEQKCKLLDDYIKINRLYFSPKPDKDFVEDIMEAKKGDILSYSDKFTVICVDDTSGNKEFYRGFPEGSKSISVSDFMNGDYYFIKDKDDDNLKYMYSLAYDSATKSVMRRKLESKNIYDFVSEIEESHKQNQVTVCNVGNCKLRFVSCDDGQNKDECIWYDSQGNHLDRDKVAMIFAWANTVSADIGIVDSNWNQCSIIDNDFIDKINAAIVFQDTENLMRYLREYSEKNDNCTSISFSGLYQEGLNYTPTTFAFSYKDDSVYVYRLNYIGQKEEIKESSVQEFLEFYNQRYSDVKNITLKRFKNVEEKDKELFFKKIVDKSTNKEILGEIITDASNKSVAVLKSYLDDAIERRNQSNEDLLEMEVGE